VKFYETGVQSGSEARTILPHLIKRVPKACSLPIQALKRPLIESDRMTNLNLLGTR
jgi:hypothetical protein